MRKINQSTVKQSAEYSGVRIEIGSDYSKYVSDIQMLFPGADVCIGETEFPIRVFGHTPEADRFLHFFWGSEWRKINTMIAKTIGIPEESLFKSETG